MTTSYTTRQGETVDIACWRYYGRTSGTVEAVLKANPGLSKKAPVLPIGTIILMPDASAKTQVAPLVSLWD